MGIINALPDQYVPVMTGSDGTNAGTPGLVPAPSAGDNEKCLKGDGTWGTVSSLPAVTASDNGKALRVAGGSWVVQENPVMVGAGSSTAGASGLVPAPSSGDNTMFLCGDGSWANPPGTKLFVVELDTVTNTSGSYTHSTTANGVSADMKAVQLELGNPGAFLSTINIVTSTNAITLTCSNVIGTSTVKVGLIFIATANAITSSEFDVLAGRIGSLNSLTTTAKTSTVDAINELNVNIGSLNSLATTAKTSLVAAANELSANMIPYSDTALSDMNNITSTAGVPYIKRWTGADTANTPININQGVVYGYKSSANFETQFAMDNSGNTYIRGKISGTWGSWNRGTNDNQLAYSTITDFNTFIPDSASVASRKYGMCSGGTASNAPVSGDNITYRGYVEGVSAYCTQHFTIEYATSVYNRSREFVRACINGTWSIWEEASSGKGCGWVPTGRDLDDIIQPGTYGLSSGSTYGHPPVSNVSGIMEVFCVSPSGTYAQQRISNIGVIYTRYRSASSGTAWGDWKKFTGGNV